MSADAERSKIKCVVWDLDNTLWQGTLLEGDAVVLTPRVTEVIEELDRRGILQSVASKNDAGAAWEKLTAFGLVDYFLLPQIAWASKAESITRIADGLGMALDAVAFVDDEAFERDEVRHCLPEVTTIAASQIGTLLDEPRMRPRFVTDESRLRRQIYQADLRLKRAQDEFGGSREEFLRTLGMSVSIRPASEVDLRRAEELTVRTNQLNTTGRPYSYDALRGLIESPNHILLVADLEDRYGSSGTVGLTLIERHADVWLVKLLIMSCRVITRGVGGIMVTYVLEAAKRADVRLRAEFIASGRNRMMYVTYRFAGFDEVAAKDDLILLEHDLATIRPFPPYVTVRSPERPQPALTAPSG